MADPPGGGGWTSTNSGGAAMPGKESIDNATQSLKTMRNELRGIDAIFKDEINKSIQGMDDRTRTVVKSIGRDLVNAAKDAVKTTKALKDSNSDIAKSLTTEDKIKEQIAKADAERESIQEHLNELVLENIAISGDMQRAADDLTGTLTEQLKLLKGRLKNVIETERAMGILGKTVEGLSKIPILGGLINTKKVLQEMETAAASTGSRVATFKAGINAIGKSMKESLTDPLVIAGGAFKLISSAISGIVSLFKIAIELGLKFDQTTFDIAKNVGVTVNEAEVLQKQFIAIAKSSENWGLRSSEVAKSYAEISDSLGFMAPSNKEFLETATLIQKRLGASAEDMSALALQSTLSGKTLGETMGTLNASRNIEGARSKLLLSQKQILDGIAKTSAAVLINFKGDVGALGDAIVRATKLGTTLDTINKQGESLLDFESSISAEFEAQLLTGRDINLTRARELALYGKTAELGEELNRQGATYQQFMSENVIARQADAKAIGLSVEEYSKILLQQQQANRLGAEQGRSAVEQYNLLVQRGKTQTEIVRMLGSEQEEADLRKASMQDKFQATIERLKDTLGQIVAGPMKDLIDDITKFLSKSENVKMIADGVKSIFKGIGSAIKNLPQILGVAIEAMKILASITAIQAAAAVTAGSAYAGPAALGIGLATYGALTALMGGTGLGKFNFAGGGSESMTEPINPSTAAVNAQTTTGGTQQAAAPAYTFHHVTQLDSQVLTNSVTKGILTTQGKGSTTK